MSMFMGEDPIRVPTIQQSQAAVAAEVARTNAISANARSRKIKTLALVAAPVIAAVLYRKFVPEQRRRKWVPALLGTVQSGVLLYKMLNTPSVGGGEVIVIPAIVAAGAVAGGVAGNWKWGGACGAVTLMGTIYLKNHMKGFMGS